MSVVNRLPKKRRTKRALIQAQVPSDLRRKVSVIMAREKWTWNEMVQAMMEQFIDEYDSGERKENI